MPSCEEGYLSKRIGALMDSWGPRASVLSVAQELQSNMTGASDTLGSEAMEEAAEIVEFYIDNWVLNTGKTNKSAYDEAVLNLLKATKRMYKERMLKRAKIPGMIWN